MKAVLDEFAQGPTLSSSGSKGMHVYPERVVKEAIVNAMIHRDYRLNCDIFIRIFDDRIKVKSPGPFPGNITPANIEKVRIQGTQSTDRAESSRVSSASEH